MTPNELRSGVQVYAVHDAHVQEEPWVVGPEYQGGLYVPIRRGDIRLLSHIEDVTETRMLAVAELCSRIDRKAKEMMYTARKIRAACLRSQTQGIFLRDTSTPGPLPEYLISPSISVEVDTTVRTEP